MNNDIIKDIKSEEDLAKLYSIDRFDTVYKNINFIVSVFIAINPFILLIIYKKYPNTENALISLLLYDIFATTILILKIILYILYNKYYLPIVLLSYDIPVDKIKFSKKDRKLIKELYDYYTESEDE